MSRPSMVAVIGLDGADWNILQPLLDAGRLPVLAGLMNRGAWARLKSVEPPVSSAAWTSMCTGVNPGAHGILGFARMDGYGSQIIRSGDVRAPQLWDILRAAGLRSLVTNLPNLYPPVDVNGVMVTGMLTPDAASRWVHPKPLQESLLHAGLGFAPRPTVRELHRLGAEDARRVLGESAALQGRTVLRLLREGPFGLVFTVLDTGDLAHHAYLGRAHAEAVETGQALLDTSAGSIIAKHLDDLDELLGEITRALPADAAILVVSDHGFEPKPKTVYLNQWLATNGYLQRSRFGGSKDAMNWRKRTVAELLGKLKLGPLARLLPSGVRERQVAVPRLGRILHAPSPNWRRTRAFLDPTALGAGIRINLAGREPQGTVSPGPEYESLRDELISRLLAWREPGTDLPVITHAWKREDIHPGPHNGAEPDVIVRYRPDLKAAHTYDPALIAPAEPDQAAWHSAEGVIIAAGPGIGPSGDLGAADIRDVAPTVLTLLGIAPPEHMEGRALACLTAEVREQAQVVALEDGVSAGSGLSGEDEAEVTARLEDLGYL